MGYADWMRGLVVAMLLVACGDGTSQVAPDAGQDACIPDLYGEACDLTVSGYCRGVDLRDAKGACVDERGDGIGVCRPWACGAVPHCNVDLPIEVQHRCPSLCGREQTIGPYAVCVP